MHTLKPLDVETILQITSTHEALFTLEEHNIHGGLGSAIAEVLAENGCRCHFKRFGIPEKLGNYISVFILVSIFSSLFSFSLVKII